MSMRVVISGKHREQTIKMLIQLYGDDFRSLSQTMQNRFIEHFGNALYKKIGGAFSEYALMLTEASEKVKLQRKEVEIPNYRNRGSKEVFCNLMRDNGLPVPYSSLLPSTFYITVIRNHFVVKEPTKSYEESVPNVSGARTGF